MFSPLRALKAFSEYNFAEFASEDWWVRNPVAANLLMLIIITGGVLGLRSIEKEAFPSVHPDVVLVDLFWPGASPKEIEQQVIQRVEDSLKNVQNVYRVTSQASESVGSVTIRTYPTVDINVFLNEICKDA